MFLEKAMSFGPKYLELLMFPRWWSNFESVASNIFQPLKWHVLSELMWAYSREDMSVMFQYAASAKLEEYKYLRMKKVPYM